MNASLVSLKIKMPGRLHGSIQNASARVFLRQMGRSGHCCALSQRKSGLPDLRCFMRNPGKPGFQESAHAMHALNFLTQQD
jgi:hypothetical protein